ncbi:MAG: hypothetical protein JSS30_04750 [Verrucomicrobia bacterium]|nr:hypothetical protein [Verrucomicrobiota bacterium]
MMTRLGFNEIMLGTSFSDVIACYGDPYAVSEPPCGGLQLEYIERITVDQILVYENHYYLLIMDDIVVSKYFCEEDRPAFDRMYQNDFNYPGFP